MNQFPHRCFGDVLEKLGDVQASQARLEAKFDAAIEAKDDHEKRLRSLEHKQWALGGVAAAIGALLGGLHIPKLW